MSTVSRALSNPERVSAAHARARAGGGAAAGLPAQPLAQALPSGRTRMLALLVADITNPHNFGLIRGAEAQARAAGYTLVLGDSRGGARSWRPSTSTGWARRWTGSCWRPAGCPTPSCVELPGRRPSCCSTGSSTGFPSVVTDSGRRQPADRRAPGRAGPPLARLPRGPARRVDRDERWGALAAARRGRRRRDRPARPVPARRWTAAPAAADVGLAVGRHRAGRVQRPAGHRRAAPAGAARASTCPRRSAWSGTTTSSAPTSATRR